VDVININIARTILISVIVVTALPVCAQQQRQSDAGQLNRRVAPPLTLECDRNSLTSYSGVVTEYRRTEKSISITISTEWDTVEEVTVEYSAERSSNSYFLLNGQQFSTGDWKKVESEPGIPIAGLRVFAWICLDLQTPPVIDWRIHSR
jgi:hypothetical protein